MGVMFGVIGIIDLFAAAAMLALYFGHPIYHLQTGMGLALIMKGVMFLPEVLSILDIVIGVTMFVLLWVKAPTLALVIAIWLLYKGVYSWF